jgi:glutaconyl-CoA/methylmalonyl-CoA decarboxylase subunit delta
MRKCRHIATVLIALLMFILSVNTCFAATEDVESAVSEESIDTEEGDAETDALMTGMSWITFVNNMSSEDLQYMVDNATSDDLEAYFPGFTNMVGGLQTVISDRDRLGEYVGVRETSTSSDEDNVYANLVLQYEQRDVEVVVGLDKNLTKYTQFSFNPVYTFGEKMSDAALNLVAGMVTVFAVLILLMGVIYCFKYVHEWEEKLKKKTTSSKTVSESESAPAAAAPVRAAGNPMNDAALVAVITAAIAAYEGTSAEGLVVRSIRRAKNNNWRRS